MNTTIKLSISGALAFGAAAAHASIASPASGSSDAILFAEVLNAAGTLAVASYAGDTGVSLNSLIGGTNVTQTVLGSDPNLTKLFQADTGSDILEWAVEGGQYTGGATSSNFGTKGVAQFLTTSTNNSTNKLNNDTTGNLLVWAKLTATVSTINTNSGGASSVEAGAPSSGGVWDYAAPTNTNSAWYNNGPVTGNALGSTQSLFYVTGNGGPVSKVLYSTLGTTAQLTSNGLTLTVSGGGGGGPPPVPLPAAVWLLGSGLLGLAGVARRKLTV